MFKDHYVLFRMYKYSRFGFRIRIQRELMLYKPMLGLDRRKMPELFRKETLKKAAVAWFTAHSHVYESDIPALLPFIVNLPPL